METRHDPPKEECNDFVFEGKLPAVKIPDSIYFPRTTGAMIWKYGDVYARKWLPKSTEFLPPLITEARPWVYTSFTSILSRLQGRDIWKRVGEAGSIVKVNPTFVSTQEELRKNGVGPRKRVCPNNFVRSRVDGDLNDLFNMERLHQFNPNEGKILYNLALADVIRFHDSRDEMGLPVPKFVAQHTTCFPYIGPGPKIDLPRKRDASRQPLLRLEEDPAQLERYEKEAEPDLMDINSVYESSVIQAPKKKSEKMKERMARRRRFVSLSTIDERSELYSSPVVEPSLPGSPFKGHRRQSVSGSSANRFTLTATPSRVTFTSSSSPLFTPCDDSPVKAAALWRTPNLYHASPMSAVLSAIKTPQQQSSPFIFDQTETILQSPNKSDPEAAQTDKTSVDEAEALSMPTTPRTPRTPRTPARRSRRSSGAGRFSSRRVRRLSSISENDQLLSFNSALIPEFNEHRRHSACTEMADVTKSDDRRRHTFGATISNGEDIDENETAASGSNGESVSAPIEAIIPTDHETEISTHIPIPETPRPQMTTETVPKDDDTLTSYLQSTFPHQTQHSQETSGESTHATHQDTSLATPLPPTPSLQLNDGDNDAVNVDLRTNLDIFGTHPDNFRNAKTTTTDAVTMKPPPPKMSDDTNAPTQEAIITPSKAQDHYMAEDDDKAAPQHEAISDPTTSFPVDSEHHSAARDEDDEGTGEGDREMATDPIKQSAQPSRPELDQDPDYEHLQSFVNRVNAGRTLRAAEAAASYSAGSQIQPKRRSGSLGPSTTNTGSPVSRSESAASQGTLSKRVPLGVKDHNVTPSPKKKRKTADDDDDDDDAGDGSRLRKPDLGDNSPPKPKRRRKNMEADTDGVLNPEFQHQGQGQPQPQAEAAPAATGPAPRRSTRSSSRRNLKPTAPSANSTALSMIPVRLPGSLVTDGSDGGFGGGPALMNGNLGARRNEERHVAAATRANTRKNRAGALPAREVVALKAKGLSVTQEPAAPPAGPTGSQITRAGAKSVRWDPVLAHYQGEPAAVAAAAAPPVAQEVEAATSPAVRPATRRATRASRLPPPTPIKKVVAAAAPSSYSSPSAPAPASATAAAAQGASLASTRRTSAQLAEASAKKAAAAASFNPQREAPPAIRRAAARRSKLTAHLGSGNGTPAPKKRGARA